MAAINVVTLMSSLTAATEAAGQMATTAKIVCETVAEVTEQSHKTLMELTYIARAEVSEFQDSMRDTTAAGETLKDRCLELKDKWDSFETHIHKLYSKQSDIGQAEVQKCIQLLQLMLQCAANCGSRYNEFREKLHHAIEVGSHLAERSKVAAEDAKSEASNTRATGYGTAGALGIAALGFLTFATGGLALIGAGAAAAAAAGTGMCTHGRASRLDELANYLNGLRGKLNDSLQHLNKLCDSITGLFMLTEKMVENMEIALNVCREQERLQREKEKSMLMNGFLSRSLEAEQKMRENERQENEMLKMRIKALENEKLKKQEKETPELQIQNPATKGEEQMRQGMSEQDASRLAYLEKQLQELEKRKKKRRKCSTI